MPAAANAKRSKVKSSAKKDESWVEGTNDKGEPVSKLVKNGGAGGSATNDEIDAAVEGTLKPRKVSGTAAQEALSATDERGRPKGRPVGVTTGLPIMMAWSYIFQKNAKAAKKDRMTDEQISAWMKSEFPGRETPAFNRPQGCRNDYNSGKFTKERIPKVQSVRYNDDGTEYVRGTAEAAPAPAPATAKKSKKVAEETVPA